MSIWTLILVGLAAGLLASLVVGGYGLLADIVVGIAGTFIGASIFRELGWHAPFTGLAGVIFVAFIGAVALLAALRLFRRATNGRSLWRR